MFKFSGGGGLVFGVFFCTGALTAVRRITLKEKSEGTEYRLISAGINSFRLGRRGRMM